MKSHQIMMTETWDILQQVARILLQHAGTDTASRSCLSKCEMTTMLGTSWDMVNSSLISLQAEGAIRIERHRIMINKDRLEQIAMGREYNSTNVGVFDE
jgi:hypothetical protein